MKAALQKLPILTPSVLLKARVTASNDSQPPLDEYFNSLFTALGPQHWWPGKSQFEVIVGAILTQSTSWKNVEQALANLRDANSLTVRAIEEIHPRRLQHLIRSAGYWRQKARALKAFVQFLRREYRGCSIECLTRRQSRCGENY